MSYRIENNFLEKGIISAQVIVLNLKSLQWLKYSKEALFKNVEV